MVTPAFDAVLADLKLRRLARVDIVRLIDALRIARQLLTRYGTDLDQATADEVLIGTLRGDS